METIVKDLSILSNYQNRQIILNYYDDEMLEQRDGFHFQKIELQKNTLSIIKNEKERLIINLETHPETYINTDFQNFYSLKNNSQRLEIYFPG